jgi:hypothetical protein
MLQSVGGPDHVVARGGGGGGGGGGRAYMSNVAMSGPYGGGDNGGGTGDHGDGAAGGAERQGSSLPHVLVSFANFSFIQCKNCKA